MLIKSAISINMSLISVLQYLNGAQLLNTTCVTALLDPAVIFPVTKIQALTKYYSNDFVKNFVGSSC